VPVDWPAAVVPDGVEICRSDRTFLTFAQFDDATPTLRETVTAHLASPAIQDTGRKAGTRTIYRVDDVEFIVLGYVGEDSDHAGLQVEVELQRCGEVIGGGDISCQE
jgi:hypothetical protein